VSEEEFERSLSDEDRISLEASSWIAKRDEGFTAKDQDAFFEWLAEDPMHKQVYADRLSFWEEMNGLADWRPEHSIEPNPDLLASRMSSRWKDRAKVLVAFAAAFAVSAIIFNIWIHEDKNEARVLAFGGAESYENHLLDDGTIIELNRGAEVSVQYSREKRLVFLHSGEAHFMVAKDSGRPFQVRAGDALVEATGTAFNVALASEGIEILVTEGRVLLDPSPFHETDEELGALANVVQELVAGQYSMLMRSDVLTAPEISSASIDEIEERLAWKAEDLDFTATPLSSVADEFNRRNRIKIEIGDSEIRDLEITAKLRSNNLDGFVALLEVAMDVAADRSDENRIILRRSDAL